MERQILHVDVNNAFLSWSAVELLKNGLDIDIREIPSVIGGDESRRAGIVLAKSMKAKVCGISTGETLYQARLKCKDLKVYSPLDYSKYKEYSNKLYNLLLNYTDKIERYSIDECFLDMTEYLMNDTLLNKAIEINKRAELELGFTVNVGVANNKLLAKMASDFAKPNKVHTLYKNEIPIKMWNLPVKDLFMLGRKTVPKLNNMGIKTIGDLAKTDSNKCIGNSVTLPQDINNEEKLKEVLLALAEQVTKRLRKYNLLARTVNIQLRNKNFEECSHQGKLNLATCSTKEVYSKAKQLFEEMYKKRRAYKVNWIKTR